MIRPAHAGKHGGNETGTVNLLCMESGEARGSDSLTGHEGTCTETSTGGMALAATLSGIKSIGIPPNENLEPQRLNAAHYKKGSEESQKSLANVLAVLSNYSLIQWGKRLNTRNRGCLYTEIYPQCLGASAPNGEKGCY